MKHRVTITSVKKEPPELDRFVAALLALAIARLEAEKSATRRRPPESKEACG